jgi:hypothetical protein
VSQPPPHIGARTQPRRATLRALSALALLGASSAPDLCAQQVPMVRGITADGEVWSIDSALGRGEPVLRAPRGWEYVGLATNARGESWVARRHVVTVRGQVLLELDPQLVRLGPDGENEPRFELPEGELPRGLAFARDGACLGLLPTQPPVLVSYDFERRAVRRLGPLAIEDAADLAWSEGRWFLWSNEVGLCELDPATLALSPLGPEPEPESFGFAFLLELPSGRLVGGRSELYDVDRFTGIANLQPGSKLPSLVGADREGPHCWFPYGAGCAGAGGFTPTLALAGCAAGGGTLSILLAGGPGGAPAAIVLGDSARIPLGHGCDFLVGELTPPLLAGFLSGENPGEGRLAFGIPLLHGTRGFAHAQGFVLDLSAPGELTATNALSLRVPF